MATKAVKKKAASKSKTALKKKAAPKKAAKKKAAKKKTAVKKNAVKKKAAKKTAPKKVAPKKTAPKKTTPKKSVSKQLLDEDGPANVSWEQERGKPGTVSIRMYCIGTGDCFVIKFFDREGSPFNIVIDCGCCMGDPDWFLPYVKDLRKYIGNTVDLLVVTHEHQDHVNGFQKCGDLFERMVIKTAWFAWTEHPDDPGGEAAELLKKRTAMKAALGSAMQEIEKQEPAIQQAIADSAFAFELKAAREAFLNGMNSLAEINLEATTETGGKPLAGMKRIKDILSDKKTRVKYLNPGSSISVDGLAGVKFHVLGPPKNRDLIFKEGKQGTDVFRKNMALNESALAARAFSRFSNPTDKPDLPFTDEYVVDDRVTGPNTKSKYTGANDNWRRIDSEWLMSAGSLALRLTSHINNTSLALAIECEANGKVILMPGDAEYGSWESWHLIQSWNKKGRNQKHLVEDLLNRTVFYKVGHHLSYNGTALEKGINMMPESNMVAMATLDRNRISKGWKSTMPNKHLLAELIRKTGGRFFIMDETEVDGAPSLTLDPGTLDEAVYKAKRRDDDLAALYKQYTFEFGHVAP
jgi:hypothetical protein